MYYFEPQSIFSVTVPSVMGHTIIGTVKKIENSCRTLDRFSSLCSNNFGHIYGAYI